MSDYTAIQKTLAAVRGKYGPTCSDDECAAICNETAWVHRRDPEQWGLSYKAGGTHGVLPDGTPVCHDVLMRGDTREGFDVLVAAGAQSTPTWSSVGIITDPSRHWVAPILPANGTTPQPPTPPAPTLKPRAQFDPEFREVNAFYAAPEGLQRPGGMVLQGDADVLAMIQWGYDLMTGATLTQVLDAIRASDEWRQKHPTARSVR